MTGGSGQPRQVHPAKEKQRRNRYANWHQWESNPLMGMNSMYPFPLHHSTMFELMCFRQISLLPPQEPIRESNPTLTGVSGSSGHCEKNTSRGWSQPRGGAKSPKGIEPYFQLRVKAIVAGRPSGARCISAQKREDGSLVVAESLPENEDKDRPAAQRESNPLVEVGYIGFIPAIRRCHDKADEFIM